ncbi:MAG TPA: glycosyltransferase [Candidatus Obscuribacterales bacterium]|nr:glycosyltransferase [Candidatus Obscuribacterales bacterium]
MLFAVFLILNTLALVVLVALMLSFFATFRTVPKSELHSEELPSISVVVPVRNEEGKVARCLESLALQDYPNFDIVVVNDKSTDASGQIISELAKKYSNIEVIQGRDSRTGWLGKCNALNHGSPHAKGDWLVFSDADTYHHPNSLRDAVGAAIKYNVDMISFMPVQELYSFGERAIMPVLLGSFLMGDPTNSINDPKSPRAYAYGQYIMVKRTTYDAIGGHESVKDQILDDISIGKVAKEKGFSVTACDGRPLYTVRMYTNFSELWNGWTKNAYALINCSIPSLIGVVVLLNLCLLAPFVTFTATVLSPTNVTEVIPLQLLWTTISLQFACMLIWYIRSTAFYKGLNPLCFLLLPLGAVLTSALYINSAYCFLTGRQVKWKDRDYSVDSSQRVTTSFARDNVAEPKTSQIL